MVGVDMRFDQPLDRETLGFYKRDDAVGGAMTSAARRIVEIEYGIDDRAGARLRVLHDVAHRIGEGVEEGVGSEYV